MRAEPVSAGRSGVLELSQGRMIAFLAICLLAALALEEPLAIAGAEPDFVIVVLVYAALRWGALGGTLLGFGLGLFRDALYLLDFGLHALLMTGIGYGVGKLRDTLYLTAHGVDFVLLVGAKLAVGLVVLGVASNGAWAAFEERFFWEIPLAALYTGGLGALLVRMFGTS